jgi:hypothetical protein
MSNRMKNHKKKGGKSQSSVSFKDPGVNSVVYRGPIQAPLNNVNTRVAVLNLVTDVTTGALVTTISQVFSSYPGGSPDWTALASVFLEYRVLGLEIIWCPGNQYQNPTNNPIVVVGDHVSAGALSGYGALAGYEGVRLEKMSNKWSFTTRMSEVGEAAFQATASTNPKFWIKIFSQNLTGSQVYGTVLQTWRVQFRGIA